MRNAGFEEAQAGIKIAQRNINNPGYADDTTLMAEIEEELKSVGSRVRHYWQNAGTAPNPSPHSAGTDPGMKELGLEILTCLFLSSAELTEKEY